MAKVKVCIDIFTTLSHTDEKCNYEPQKFSGRKTQAEIEIEIPDDMIEIFSKLWGRNLLTITVSGGKQFRDAEEIS
jgi:hypothetical protein